MIARIIALSGVVLSIACGGGSAPPIAVQIQSLTIDQVKAVEVLVFGGVSATCTRVLDLPVPLDDPGLIVEGHALFAIDGTPKYLANLPADVSLAFYAEGYASRDEPRTIIGRGCTAATIKDGGSTAVTLTLAPVQ